MKAEGEDIADLTAEKIVDAAQNTDRYCIEFAEGEFLQEPDTRIRFYKNALYFFPIRGSLAYLAAWDVRPAKVFGRCDETTGIVPFNRLVEHVMAQEPYRSAPRVFWIMDNGTSHRGERGDKRIQGKWKNIVPVHTPVHASWLNQVEIYFSVVQRKVLTPNDFDSLAAVEDRLLRFQEHYERAANPFRWKFTRRDLVQLLERIKEIERRRDAAA